MKNKEEWYKLKVKVANAFAALHFVYGLNEKEIDNLTLCLYLFNEQLDKLEPKK